MKQNLNGGTRTGCLRFTFDDMLVTRDVCANATFEEIARTLSGCSRRRYGMPLAISVIFDQAPAHGRQKLRQMN